MNSFGKLFRVSIFGESHGEVIGVLLDGVRPGIKLSESDFDSEMARRKPNKFGTPRTESDTVIIKTGVFNGYTTGAPILLEIENKNINSKDYDNLKYHFRPGHSDYTASVKYQGFNDYRGGGMFSGRLTAALVCAGVVADKIKHFDVSSDIVNIFGESDKTLFESILNKAKEDGDSVGGVVKVEVKNMEKSLGEPYFDSLESVLSHGLFSVPAVKGVSFGVGFSGTNLKGSEYNDLIIDDEGKTSTNNNGGINGGISNGNDLIINVFIKPTPSVSVKQNTYNFKVNKIEELEVKGRHDSAIILRIPVVLEAIVRIVLTDLYLQNKVVYYD